MPRPRLFVDRIEDGRLAVFSVEGGGQVVLPLSLCPPGLREGRCFDLDWKENPAAERRLRDEVADLQRALLKKSKPPEKKS
ncbi:MAG: DUF3006 domain-containing protein [Elusimicrobiota bacterium]